MNASDFTIDQIMSLLSQCYEKALIGLPTSKTAKQMADEYVTRYINPDLAVKKLVDSQVLKCTTSGFLIRKAREGVVPSLLIFVAM